MKEHITLLLERENQFHLKPIRNSNYKNASRCGDSKQLSMTLSGRCAPKGRGGWEAGGKEFPPLHWGCTVLCRELPGCGGSLDMATVSSALQWGWARSSSPPRVLRRMINWNCGHSWALQSGTQTKIKCSRLFSQLSPQWEAASPEQREVAPGRCCPRKPCNVCHGNM